MRENYLDSTGATTLTALRGLAAINHGVFLRAMRGRVTGDRFITPSPLVQAELKGPAIDRRENGDLNPYQRVNNDESVNVWEMPLLSHQPM
jgi:hypothetical protein